MRGQMFRFTSSPSCTARWSPQGRSRHQGVVHPVIMGEVLLPNCVAHGAVPIQIVFIVANTAFELSHVFISWSPTQIRTHMHDAKRSHFVTDSNTYCARYLYIHWVQLCDAIWGGKHDV